ncbi:MAG: branched-chain amino acid aminotransferase [Bacteroidia bacterium]|nr:branched-chain amino acid aminotransferase [Bacteroidia bacterium]
MDVVSDFLKITQASETRISEIDMNNIPFGRVFSDHMLVAHCINGEWQQAEIKPYAPLNLTPANSALNYGQSVFEGMKAHKSPEGRPVLFRARENWLRINYSAHRMAMPPIPEEIFMEGIRELVKLDSNWLPNPDQGALYLRPLYFAADEYIGVKASDNYTFVVFTCPVGPYYSEPVNLLVNKDYIRAAIGGTGAAKAAGNYASAMLPDKMAKANGYHNVMWLDARHGEYVEECGTMNIFFVIDGEVVTPRLTGTILPGITRNSCIQLMEANGYKVTARQVSVYELQQAYREGKLEECFGTGTAATVSHVAKIGFGGEEWVLPAVSERKIGPWLYNALMDYRLGAVEDTFGWVELL